MCGVMPRCFQQIFVQFTIIFNSILIHFTVFLPSAEAFSLVVANTPAESLDDVADKEERDSIHHTVGTTSECEKKYNRIRVGFEVGKKMD